MNTNGPYMDRPMARALLQKAIEKDKEPNWKSPVYGFLKKVAEGLNNNLYHRRTTDRNRGQEKIWAILPRQPIIPNISPASCLEITHTFPPRIGWIDLANNEVVSWMTGNSSRSLNCRKNGVQ